MATLRDMIRRKGSEVFGISPEATVYEALDTMAKHNTGALLVMEGEKMVGILSERDCVRKVDLQGRSSRETKVSEIMTRDVITVSCDQPLEECMHLMQDKGSFISYSRSCFSTRNFTRRLNRIQFRHRARCRGLYGGTRRGDGSHHTAW